MEVLFQIASLASSTGSLTFVIIALISHSFLQKEWYEPNFADGAFKSGLQHHFIGPIPIAFRRESATRMTKEFQNFAKPSP
ncbi:unnamed protein product [Sphenostylis stenocarpa]|uniref:Uncharacterized protein n=1 Tax=Sphenostylis stenocarpa TaxID=92480 RepID=A0AA87B8V5_9FABA|nr:unnamed protein product [Sphenostylis stenocarpa]